jgi:hypothetical protein
MGDRPVIFRLPRPSVDLLVAFAIVDKKSGLSVCHACAPIGDVPPAELRIPPETTSRALLTERHYSRITPQ